MKKLNINITKAQIVSFSVQLKDNEPVVSCSIALITDGGKEIANYSISTQSWQEESKFELPTELIDPIIDIMRTLEGVVVKHCMGHQKQIGAKQ